MNREEQIMNDPSLACYVDKQREWINEAFMDGVRWADENRPVDWQQARIQSAIAAMQGFCANPNYFELNSGATIPEAAIVYSDVLIEKLKGE